MENTVNSIQVRIQVPYKSAGNTIIQKEVGFDVHKDEAIIKAVPQLNENELRLANLPGELSFSKVDGKVVSTRGAKDGNMHVITDIVAALEQQGFPV